MPPPIVTTQLIKVDQLVVVRFYPPDVAPVYPAKYDFFTLAAITGNQAEIIGLENCDIKTSHMRVGGEALVPYGVESMFWDHGGKRIFRQINAAKTKYTSL